MARAYFTPYGVGLGHASRLVTIASRLNSHDVSVRFSSYGEATSYIELHGFKCNTVPPMELDWSGDSGFSIKNSLGNVPEWFSNFSRQITSEIRNLMQFSPDVVVSDTRLSPIFSARMVGFPSIVILNQVKLLLSPRLRKIAIARIFEKMNGEFLGGLWNISEKVLIPDLPPPYTISEQNIWDCDSIQKKVEYVGFTIPRTNFSQERLDSVLDILEIKRERPLVFVHISGPPSTRLNLISKILQSIKHKESNIQFIISEGRPNGNTDPTKLSESVWYYQWCPIKDEIFRLCDMVIIRGGHTAISQAIEYGKPILTIPIQNQGEQLGNSEKVAKLGIGIKLDPVKIEIRDLSNAITEVLHNSHYSENIQRVMEVSNALDGIENVVKIIRSYF